MASAARKYEFLVVVPDFPGVRDKRLAVRPQHFAGLKTMIDSGNLQMGGAVLTEVPKDDEASSMQFAGSTLVVTAGSREEIIEMLKKDVYAESGVWDVEKSQIWPLKCAVRKPL